MIAVTPATYPRRCIRRFPWRVWGCLALLALCLAGPLSAHGVPASASSDERADTATGAGEDRVSQSASDHPDFGVAFVDREVKFRPSIFSDFNFGHSVAISGDTAVVGIQSAVFSVPDNEPMGTNGAAYVFVRNSAGAWTFQARLQASDGVERKTFGESVAVSGNTIVVGAYSDSSRVFRAGSAYVFTRSGTTWTQTAKLEANDSTRIDEFGWSVAIEGDDILIGAPGHDLSGRGDAGAVYLFQGTQQAAKFTSPTSFAVGYDVSVSQGNVIVGTQSDAAHVLRLSGSALTETVKLAASVSGQFGRSVAVRGDTALIGAPAERIGAAGFNQGAAYIFTAANGVWTQAARLAASDGAPGDRFGYDVALGGERLALVGAPSHNVGTTAVKEGVAYVFERGSIRWIANAVETEIVVATDAGQGERSDSGMTSIEFYGWSVAGDGSNLLVGAKSDTDDTGVYASQGAAYAYTHTPAPTGVPGPPLNLRAAVSGNTLSLTWDEPAYGGTPAGYDLLAYTVSNDLLTSLTVGRPRSFSATAPNGSFVLTVRAFNDSGTGAESNAVTVTIPQAALPPGPPSNLAANVTGTTANFTWSPPSSGGAVRNYVLVAGLTPGFSVPYAIVPIGATASLVVPGAPAGTFYLRVLAQNAGGTSAPSNEVVLTVAGLARPGAPTLNPPTVSGSTVSLSWSSGSGGTPTGYTLTGSVTPGGAPIATVPLTGSSASFPGIPSGTFYLRLIASNAAGTSPASAEVTLIVP